MERYCAVDYGEMGLIMLWQLVWGNLLSGAVK